MDYITRYGLEFNPFIKNSQDFIVETSEYKEALFRFQYLLKNKGFGVLIGAPGRGKTTMLRHFAKKLNPSLYKVIYISLSTLTVVEFYKYLAELLGLEARTRKTDNYKLIQNEINRLSIEKRITPVIIIDEANYVNNAILNDLKMLFNFEMDSKDRAVILFAGLPQLNNTLQLVANEPLRQRITMNYHLESLIKEEGRLYIKERLKHAKCTQEVFDESAIEAILNAANGVPRIINKICDFALIIGHNKDLSIINADIIMEAVNESELG
jgi:type II secretory pathway predicted ATPase ExeA